MNVGLINYRPVVVDITSRSYAKLAHHLLPMQKNNPVQQPLHRIDSLGNWYHALLPSILFLEQRRTQKGDVRAF